MASSFSLTFGLSLIINTRCKWRPFTFSLIWNTPCLCVCDFVYVWEPHWHGIDLIWRWSFVTRLPSSHTLHHLEIHKVKKWKFCVNLDRLYRMLEHLWDDIVLVISTQQRLGHRFISFSLSLSLTFLNIFYKITHNISVCIVWLYFCVYALVICVYWSQTGLGTQHCASLAD